MNGDGEGSGWNPRILQGLIALLIGGIAMGVYAIRGCESGPFGRKQIVKLTPEQEVALGAEAYKEVVRGP